MGHPRGPGRLMKRSPGAIAFAVSAEAATRSEARRSVDAGSPNAWPPSAAAVSETADGVLVRLCSGRDMADR